MNYPSTLSDEQLIQYFLNGDPGAMATLVALYKDRVYTSIYHIVRNKEHAEEIFQAVFIKVIDDMIAGKIVEEGKFVSWAMQIAHGLCLERSRNLLSTSATFDTTLKAVTLHDLMITDHLINSNTFENHDKIRTMIERLPARQREVIVLNHYRGMGFKAISELLKCSLTNTLETMRFGLRNLGKLMVEKEVAC